MRLGGLKGDGVDIPHASQRSVSGVHSSMAIILASKIAPHRGGRCMLNGRDDTYSANARRSARNN